MTNWPYYTWNEASGLLIDDDGNQFSPQKFGSAQEAEQYLVDNDFRGSVR